MITLKDFDDKCWCPFIRVLFYRCGPDFSVPVVEELDLFSPWWNCEEKRAWKQLPVALRRMEDRGYLVQQTSISYCWGWHVSLDSNYMTESNEITHSDFWFGTKLYQSLHFISPAPNPTLSAITNQLPLPCALLKPLPPSTPPFIPPILSRIFQKLTCREINSDPEVKTKSARVWKISQDSPAVKISIQLPFHFFPCKIP